MASPRIVPITDTTLAFLAGRVLLCKQLLDDAKASRTPVFTDVHGLRRLQTRLREELDGAVHAWLVDGAHMSHHDESIDLRIHMTDDGLLDLCALIEARAEQG